jgi:hypothetical protein
MFRIPASLLAALALLRCASMFQAPGRWRATAIAWVVVLGGSLLLGTGTARAAWDQMSQLLSLRGKPVPASANVLSEHEIEALAGMPAQAQAELLLERSINHYAGANEQIAARVKTWAGQITLDERLRPLFMTAINSDDLRVRAAGSKWTSSGAIWRRAARRSIDSNRSHVTALRASGRTPCGISVSSAAAAWTPSG